MAMLMIFELGESAVNFSVAVDDISGIDDQKIDGKLVPGGDSKWEIALLDFCMPNNIRSFQNIFPGLLKSAAYVHMRVSYKRDRWLIKDLHEHLPRGNYDVPTLVKIVNDSVRRMCMVAQGGHNKFYGKLIK